LFARYEVLPALLLIQVFGDMTLLLGKQSLSVRQCKNNYLTLKMKALWSLKTPGNTRPMTQHYVPQDLNLQDSVSNNLHIRLQLMLWIINEVCERLYNNARIPFTWYDVLVVRKSLLFYVLCVRKRRMPLVLSFLTFFFCLIFFLFFCENKVSRNAGQCQQQINCAMLKETWSIKMKLKH